MFVLVTQVFLPFQEYNKAVKAAENGSYIEAINAFSNLGDYKDSEELLIESKFNYGKQVLSYTDYDTAAEIFTSLGEYKNAPELLSESIRNNFV